MSEGAIRALRPHETRPARHAGPTAKKSNISHGLGSDSVRIAAVSQAEMSSQTIQPLLASLRSYAQAAVTFMRESNTPLSESHGCLHVSPQDIAILGTYVKVGSRINIHSYGETSPQVDMPFIEAADHQMKPKDITLEIFPRPDADVDGGFGIVYRKGAPLGRFKVTGGPPEIGKIKGRPAGPTRPASTTVSRIGWHESEKYPDSFIPGGVEIRIADGEHFDLVDVEKFRNRDTGEIIETSVPRNLPELYYREFDYGRNAYTDRWIKITDKDFYQALLRKDPRIELPADYSYDFNSYPFETRYVDGRRTIYYIGSSFGNGDLLPSGERHPQLTFNWGTQEYIHYGLADEREYKYLMEYAAAYFKGENPPDIPVGMEITHDLSTFREKLSDLKLKVEQQAGNQNIGDEPLGKIVGLMLAGYTRDAEELLSAILQHNKLNPREPFYVELNYDELFAGKNKIEICGVEITCKRDKGNPTHIVGLTLKAPIKDPKGAYDRLKLVALRLGRLPMALFSFEKFMQSRAMLRGIFGEGANNQSVVISLSEV